MGGVFSDDKSLVMANFHDPPCRYSQLKKWTWADVMQFCEDLLHDKCTCELKSYFPFREDPRVDFCMFLMMAKFHQSRFRLSDELHDPCLTLQLVEVMARNGAFRAPTPNALTCTFPPTTALQDRCKKEMRWSTPFDHREDVFDDLGLFIIQERKMRRLLNDSSRDGFNQYLENRLRLFRTHRHHHGILRAALERWLTTSSSFPPEFYACLLAYCPSELITKKIARGLMQKLSSNILLQAIVLDLEISKVPRARMTSDMSKSPTHISTCLATCDRAAENNLVERMLQCYLATQSTYMSNETKKTLIYNGVWDPRCLTNEEYVVFRTEYLTKLRLELMNSQPHRIDSLVDSVITSFL